MVSGWVRSVRTQKARAFLHLDDGSCAPGLQLVLAQEQTEVTREPSLWAVAPLTNWLVYAATRAPVSCAGDPQAQSQRLARAPSLRRILHGCVLCSVPARPSAPRA